MCRLLNGTGLVCAGPGQDHREHRAVVGRLRLHPTPLGQGDLANDEQPQAQARRLLCVPGRSRTSLELGIPISRRDASTNPPTTVTGEVTCTVRTRVPGPSDRTSRLPR
jgi:hypothetical protein